MRPTTGWSATRWWWTAPHAPPGYPPGSPPEDPMPLVMMFHGAHGSGKGMSQGIHFNRLAEEHGLVVAYPDAEVGNWAGRLRLQQRRPSRDQGYGLCREDDRGHDPQ
ncbi:MAG: PHB depolymerase family esterase [Balneolaceae bacterium]|nr:PHB depolymerase family esterase [Balneolaceae bacterium]